MQRGLCGQLPFLTPDVTSCCCAPEAPPFYAGSQSYSADRSNAGWHGPHKGRRGREKKLCQQSRVSLAAVPLAAALLPLCAPGPTTDSPTQKNCRQATFGEVETQSGCLLRSSFFAKFRRPRRPAPTRATTDCERMRLHSFRLAAFALLLLTGCVFVFGGLDDSEDGIVDKLVMEVGAVPGAVRHACVPPAQFPVDLD
jgi:hypothetical protein